MKVVLFSDLHAHNFSQFATTLSTGRNSRFQNTLNVLNEITKFCQTHVVDLLVFTGDLFHSRTKIDVDVYSGTWEACKHLCASVGKAYFLTGNHDQASKNGRIHSLEAFTSFATVVDQPLLERVGEVVFAAHPFTTNMKQWHRFVEMIPKGLDFFLFHQGICEAAVGAFNISIKAEVSYADLPHEKAKYCLGGHYHRRQWLGGEKRVGFVGSPLQHSFGEREDPPKGWLFFEDHRKPPEFIPSSAPQFRLYKTPEEFFDHLAGDAADPRAPWNRDDFIRVRAKQQSDADKIKREFPTIQLEMIGKEEFEERRVNTDVVSSDRILLEAYVEQNANGLDRERLLSFGLEMLSGDQT